jgi:cytoskeletal protein RodZ
MNRVDRPELGRELRQALDDAGMTVDAVADKTKVPRSTIAALLGEDVAAVLPPRVYLRGHLGLIVREIGLEVEEWLKKFDAAYPVVEEEQLIRDMPRLKTSTIAVAAGIGGVGILAVVLAFAG